MTNLVVLTGAGISAESGIRTFRDSDGLWNDHDVMKIATPEGFAADPDLVNGFYNARRAELKNVQPNDGHRALARLEEAWKDKGGFLLVTQNVDDLHERAGSENMAHIHGELCGIRCTSCGLKERTEGAVTGDTKCVSCGSAMRPDVVWFGEMPNFLDMLEVALDHTDIFISVGTSGSVMPASLFPAAVRMAKPEANIIEVNPNPTGDVSFNEVIQGTAVESLDALVDRLIAEN